MAQNKRDHHTGTIVERKNTLHCCRVMLGYKKNEKGRTVANRVQIKANSKVELTRKVAALRKKFEEEGLAAVNRMTMEELCNGWKRQHRLSGIRASTQENYDYMIDCHIIPKYGPSLINEIKPQDIQLFLREKTVDGRSDKKGGLSACSVNRIHIVLGMIFAYAVDQEYLLRSPMSKVKKINAQDKTKIRFMNDEQISKLLSVMAKFRLRSLFHFMLATGVRRGEALGLTWTDVDFEQQQVLISQALIKDRIKKTTLGPLKSKGSTRQIPLHADDFAQLLAWKNVQDEEKALLGDEYEDNGLVFCSIAGKPIYPDTPGEWLEDYCAKAKISRFTLHDLRHTYASRMIRSGTISKVLQELLGHATIAMTMDIYGHLFKGMKRDAVDKSSPVLPVPEEKTDEDKAGMNSPDRESNKVDTALEGSFSGVDRDKING